MNKGAVEIAVGWMVGKYGADEGQRRMIAMGPWTWHLFVETFRRRVR